MPEVKQFIIHLRQIQVITHRGVSVLSSVVIIGINTYSCGMVKDAVSVVLYVVYAIRM